MKVTLCSALTHSPFDSYFSSNIKSDVKVPTSVVDPSRSSASWSAASFDTSVSSRIVEYPTDLSLMHKEITQCQNIIDRLEKILGVLPNEDDDDERVSQSVDGKRRTLADVRTFMDSSSKSFVGFIASTDDSDGATQSRRSIIGTVSQRRESDDLGSVVENLWVASAEVGFLLHSATGCISKMRGHREPIKIAGQCKESRRRSFSGRSSLPIVHRLVVEP